MTMPSLRLHLAIACVLAAAALHALASDVKVIANSSVKADMISARELKSVFLQEENSLAGGIHVEPVLQKGGPVHEDFLRAYLGRTDDDLQTYYRALVFTGRGSMPKEFGSDAEVISYVAKTRGAIGYVSAETPTEGVRIMAVGNAGSTTRSLITRIEPEYPETLKRLSIGGTVRLQVTIAPKGNVENIQLLGGNPILAEAATAAVEHWIYSPAHSSTTTEVSIPFDPRR
jgi:TonB family protein